jgi:phosphoketolase
MIENAMAKAASQGPLSTELLAKMNDYWRAANYLSVGQIYLKDNPLLERELTLDDVKPRLAAQADAAQQWYSEQIQCHKLYVAENGDDLPEIKDWRWPAERAGVKP